MVHRVSNVIRAEDTFARLGGDEFVIMPSSFKKLSDTLTIVHKILDCFHAPFNINGQNIDFHSSIGIAIFPDDGVTAETLIEKADIAMYHCKENGGDQFRLYQPSRKHALKKNVSIVRDLKEALNSNHLYLAYQPQYSSTKNVHLITEALIRWSHPEKGNILPFDFIPNAERSGLIVPIGEWVIHEACKQHIVWREMGLPAIQIAVNISAQQLRQYNFAERVLSILNQYNLKTETIVLEVTENAFFMNDGSLCASDNETKLR